MEAWTREYQFFREKKLNLSCCVLALLPSLAPEPKACLTVQQIEPAALVSEFDKDTSG